MKFVHVNVSYEFNTKGVARNNLDMEVLCTSEHGYEMCRVGHFVFLTPAAAAATTTTAAATTTMSCCEASAVVLQELRWQGIDLPLGGGGGERASIIDLAELSTAKEVLHHDAMCKAAFMRTVDLQRDFETTYTITSPYCFVPRFL